MYIFIDKAIGSSFICFSLKFTPLALQFGKNRDHLPYSDLFVYSDKKKYEWKTVFQANVKLQIHRKLLVSNNNNYIIEYSYNVS